MKERATGNRLQHVSLREAALREIRGQIGAGLLKQGQLYSIGEIAESLGTSPTPVREALLDLENRGLVTFVRNRGVRVSEIDDCDLENILEIRLMLEVPALRKLAAMPERPSLEDSKELCEKAIAAATNEDVLVYLALDRDFHLSLIDKIGNPRLSDIVGQMRDQTRLYGIAHLDREGLIASAREHISIIEAIEAGDGGRVEMLLNAHLRQVTGSWGTPTDIANAAAPMEYGHRK